MKEDSKARALNRSTLRNLFREGRMPTANDFASLVESSVNLEDDGFRKTKEHGIELAPLGADRGMLAFFDYPAFRDRGAPRWSVGFDGETHDLRVDRGAGDDDAPDGSAALLLSESGGLGVRIAGTPSNALEVGGTVQAHGRAGRAGEVVADGKWQNVTEALVGCHALEIVAGVGGEQGKGHYALVHATALNAFHPYAWYEPLLRLLPPLRDYSPSNRDRPIRIQQAVYLRAARLQLRWFAEPGQRDPTTRAYRLQIRSYCPHGDTPPVIRYAVTRLWFDPWMTRPPAESFVDASIRGGDPVDRAAESAEGSAHDG